MNRTTYCRARGIRAFTDKEHGWTLVTRAGEFVCLRNAASLTLWEALAEPADEDALVEGLQSGFAAVPPERLRRDVRRFLEELQDLGLVTAQPPGPRCGTAVAGAD